MKGLGGCLVFSDRGWLSPFPRPWISLPQYPKKNRQKRWKKGAVKPMGESMKKESYLPGLEPSIPDKGEVEAETEKSINALQAKGVLTEAHAGLAALAIIAARNVDQMGESGAPSGRANMLSAAKDILTTLIPATIDESGDELDKVLAALDYEPEQVIEFTHAPTR